MNSSDTTLNRLSQLAIISLLSLSVMSCGGGGSSTSNAGISGTGISTGTVTGFGSVFVNGIRYEVDNIEFSQNFKVDDSTGASQDDLKIGMVVEIQWTSFDDGSTQADALVYDDSVEGPITSPVTLVAGSTSKKEFDVLNDHVIIDASSTSFEDSTSPSSGFDFDTIAQEDVIEVSGFIDGNGNILATLIEKKGDTVATPQPFVELRGLVAGLTPDVSFFLNTIEVNFDSNTPLDDLPDGVQEGLIVEVKGTYDSVNNSIQASEIEGEDDDVVGSGDPNASVSIQGPIANFVNVSSEFTVSGVRVQLVASAIPPAVLSQLADGLIVEVEGMVVNNVLQADQVEIRESGAEYRAIVRSIDIAAQTLNIGYLPPVTGELVMQLDSRSTVIDEDNNPISLNDIVVGDDVKISARIVDPDYIVVRLKREQGENKSYEITGKVQQFDSLGGQITIEDLVFTLDSNVSFDASFGNPPVIVVDQVLELEDSGEVIGTTARDGLIDSVSPPG